MMRSERRETVLVVDDDPGVMELQRRRLERSGFQVDCAASAPQAMERLQQGGVVLVLLDYRLSGELNGLEFYAAMKGAGYETPVIMVTGCNREPTVVEALRAGVRDFVSKSPEYLDYLPEAVSRVLEQVRTEQRLAESQARLAAIVDSSMDAIVAIDAEGRITLFNAAAERMFGAPACRAVGQRIERFVPHLGDLAPPGDRGEFDTRSGTAPFETHGYRGGEPILLEVSLSPGEAVGEPFYTAIVRDITQRKRLDAELRLAKEAADAASNAKSAFLANMSHELRTPLTAILGFAQLLQDEGCQGPDAREVADVIQRNGRYLLDIVNDLLDISKIEAGALAIEPAPCSPSRLLDDVYALMQVRSQAKGLAFTIERDGPLPQLVTTDPLRLRQILINLLGNAIKFTEQGRIGLSVRTLGDDGERLQFEVTDTGIGMDAEQVARVFRAFTQADNSTTRKYGGTGLGLAISKRLAHLLGGDLSVISQLGGGSSFRLTIPTKPPRTPGAAATDGAPRATSSEAHIKKAAFGTLSGRILLAEDAPDTQRLVSCALRRAGAEVVVVENGLMALEQALTAKDQGRAFGVILMDMQMPVLDGYGATSRLRALAYDLPIIAFTAHAMTGDREKCLAVGCDDFAVKPINFPQLIATLRKWLAPSEAPAEEAILAGV